MDPIITLSSSYHSTCSGIFCVLCIDTRIFTGILVLSKLYTGNEDAPSLYTSTASCKPCICISLVLNSFINQTLIHSIQLHSWSTYRNRLNIGIFSRAWFWWCYIRLWCSVHFHLLVIQIPLAHVRDGRIWCDSQVIYVEYVSWCGTQSPPCIRYYRWFGQPALPQLINICLVSCQYTRQCVSFTYRDTYI